MKNRFICLLAAAVAVFGLITACDDGGKESNDGEFTVTFNKNHNDQGGWTPADPSTITVKAGEAVGEFPKAPTRSQGWGTSTVLEGWYKDKDCTDWFEDDEPVTKNITVYAKWDFQEKTAEVVGETLVHNAPKIDRGGAMHGSFDGAINDDGSITWQRGGIRYQYPSQGLDYDYVEIEYIGKDKDGKESGTIQNNILKDYDSTNDYKPSDGSTQYPALALPTGKIKFLVRDAPKGGLAIQIYVPNTIPADATDEQLAPYKRTMKFTKATFTKGERYTITYDRNNDASNTALNDGFGVKGLPIGTLPYLDSAGGKEFAGWYLASDTAFATEIKAATVPTEAQIVNGTLALKAKWDTLVPASTITVDFSANGIGLTPIGAGTTVTVLTDDGSDTGYTFTYGSGNYNSSAAKFNVTLGSSIKLSSYKQVTVEYQSNGGDTGYKDFALLAAATLPSSLPTDPHTTGGTEIKINSGTNPRANTTTGDTWGKLIFTIDKAKAAGLTGTIQVCIYDHSAADKDGTKTSWKIKNVKFEADSE